MSGRKGSSVNPFLVLFAKVSGMPTFTFLPPGVANRILRVTNYEFLNG